MERKGDFISNIRYKKEIEVVTFQGKEITLEGKASDLLNDESIRKAYLGE